MRTIGAFLITGALCAVVASSFAAPSRAQGPPEVAQTLADIFFTRLPPRPPDADRALAGLSPNSNPELLTWERVYTLALVRSRGGSARGGDALDANAIDRLANRHGVADFGRFRQDFLDGHAGAGGTFLDPSGDYLGLLRRLQLIDNAQHNAAFQENCLKLCQELIKGEHTGLSQLEIDLIEASVCRARQNLADEAARFRDQLDELNAGLGLPLDAPWIVDRRGIAAFGEAFEELHDWHLDPKRTFHGLTQLIGRLPAMGELVIEGKPVLGTIEADPGRLEEVLASATRVANRNRAGRGKGDAARNADVALELRIRRHVRSLMEARRADQTERRSLEMAHRLLDQFLAQLVDRHGMLALTVPTGSLIQQSVLVRNAQDLLAIRWTSFQAERLALYRDLGVLPYDDWKSFYDDLSARLGPIKK